MQSGSDDDVRKRLLEKPRFELAATATYGPSRRSRFSGQQLGKHGYHG